MITSCRLNDRPDRHAGTRTGVPKRATDDGGGSAQTAGWTARAPTAVLDGRRPGGGCCVHHVGGNFTTQLPLTSNSTGCGGASPLRNSWTPGVASVRGRTQDTTAASDVGDWSGTWISVDMARSPCSVTL